MLRIGLTGSIGMGKSTMGKLFAEAGVPVNDSDAVVHDLYAGEAAPLVDAAFPGTMKEGAVDRQELARQLAGSADGFKRLEAIVHPLVRKREAEFIERERQRGSPMVLLDIPLLFETGAESRVDVIVVVSCDPQIQRERVLARPGMTVEKFDMILARQTPDAEKRGRADFIVENSDSLEHLQTQVDSLSRKLAELARNQKP